MKTSKNVALGFTFIISILSVVAFADDPLTDQEIRINRLNALYEALHMQTFADKQTMADYDFVDWPRDDANSVAVADFPNVLKNYGATLVYGRHGGPDGHRFDWNFKGLPGKIHIAVYPNAEEAQLHLLERLKFVALPFEKGHPWKAEGIGDVSFSNSYTSEIFFVRKNICVYAWVKGDSADAIAVLNQLCEHVDTVIQNSPLLNKAEAPFKVEINKTVVEIDQEVTLEVTPKKPDVLFTVDCLQLKGLKLERKCPTSTLKSGKPRICTFSSQIPGERRIKVYICEKSGMVWTYYIQFNVFQ